MRAISVFSLEAGTSTFGWRACIALRTRVSMSAMGSLVIFLLPEPPGRAIDRGPSPRPQHLAPGSHISLPTGLRHAGYLAIQGELPEAQAAYAELAQEPARAPAAPAAVTMPALQLGRLSLPGDL